MRILLDNSALFLYHIVAYATIAYATIAYATKRIRCLYGQAKRRGIMPAFMKHIGLLWRCANLYRAEKYESIGLGAYQDAYLTQICKTPGISQEKLAGIICVHKSNVARQLASLEEKGFVERRVDAADRRNLLVYPTQKALNALETIHKVRAEWNGLLFSGMDEEQVRALAKSAEALAARARAIVGEGEKE